MLPEQPTLIAGKSTLKTVARLPPERGDRQGPIIDRKIYLPARLPANVSFDVLSLSKRATVATSGRSVRPLPHVDCRQESDGR